MEEGGLAGLVPARPGPRRAHKLTDEVVAFARERLAADPSLRSADLVDAISRASGSACTGARSSARSPAPRGRKRRATDERAGDRDDVERYERLRSHALGGDPAGRLGLALLQRRGVAAWMRAWPSTTPAAPARPALAAAPAGEEIVGVLATMALACLAA